MSLIGTLLRNTDPKIGGVIITEAEKPAPPPAVNKWVKADNVEIYVTEK